jgi:flagellar hook-associated protein 3 FlgL
MSFRVTDSARSQSLASRIARGHARTAAAEERLTSGKRINRPSDDPSGAGTVSRLRSLQETIDGFRRSAGLAHDHLIKTDTALESYETILDRASALLTQAASDTTTAESRQTIATELDSIRSRIIALANTNGEDGYLFGGTRQDASPVDAATGALNANPTRPSLVRLERDAPPVQTGSTADKVFANDTDNIFATLASASASLRGASGNAATDRQTLLDAMRSLNALAQTARVARTETGASLSQITNISERHTSDYLQLATTIDRLESADFAQAAIELTASQTALEAIFRAGSPNGRRSLIDFLG